MAHKIALRAADYIEAAQGVAVEYTLSYVEVNYENESKPLKCCVDGMLFVGAFLSRKGHIENAEESFHSYVLKFWDVGGNAMIIAVYARVPQKLTRRLETLHLNKKKSCDEIVAMLRNGELDAYCV